MRDAYIHTGDSFSEGHKGGEGTEAEGARSGQPGEETVQGTSFQYLYKNLKGG